MTDAINTPVRRARREQHSTDHPIGQMEPLSLDVTEEVDRKRIVEADESALVDGYATAIGFAEEPVVIMVNPASERNAAQWVECWVNGKGAEVLIEGRWTECPYMPVGVELTVKRKYVEVLLRSKQTTWQTNHVAADDAKSVHVDNKTIPTTMARNSVSILSDRNPMGREWLKRVMAEKE